MATYDLTQVELSALLTGNIDPSVREFVLNYLFDPDADNPMGTVMVHGHDDDDDDDDNDPATGMATVMTTMTIMGAVTASMAGGTTTMTKTMAAGTMTIAATAARGTMGRLTTTMRSPYRSPTVPTGSIPRPMSTISQLTTAS